MKKRKAVNYINNRELYDVMVKFVDDTKFAKEEGKQPPRIPNYVGECFLKICNKLATRPNFGGYTYKDEMISDGIENCIVAVYGFNPEKSTNPFAYFTMIAWNAFIRRIKKEKKENYIKHKNFENNNLMDEFLQENYGQKYSSDYSRDVISNFEESIIKQV